MVGTGFADVNRTDGSRHAADLADDGGRNAVGGWGDWWGVESLIRMHGVGVSAAGVGRATASMDSGDNGRHGQGLVLWCTDLRAALTEDRRCTWA